jgi:exonuclease SbcC
MHGFASFREPTTVDFTGADYFALVGPTGAGKSTVIDALTFALYGSVPRWDNQRTVSLALAPTAGRGVVRLVFDLAGQRYVVARELRRAASGSVTVRSARLERLRDPDDADGDTEPLADGAGGVTAAVEALLGLPFGDFTTCVVLPQGDFAEFLHTEPRKRQEKLVRILGLGVYDRIAREANTDAAAQRQRAEVLAEQLTGYADATEEAQSAAAERVAALVALEERVEARVPEVAAAAQAQRTAEDEAGRIRAEGTALAALVVPDGLAALAERQRTAAAAVAAAGERAAAADAEDAAARDAVVGAPARGPLERARRDHAARSALVAELPGVRERLDKARAADEVAAREAAHAREALDAARTARDGATADAERAADAARRLEQERAGLRAVRVPAGLDALAGRRRAAVAARDAAAGALTAAEEAEALARSARAAAPERTPLVQARRDHDELAALLDEQGAVAGRLAAAEQAETRAADRTAAARHARAHADAARTAALRADLAAALRPGLVEGEECPVCAQAVAALPPALPAADLAAVDRALAAATAEQDDAQRAHAGAVAARERLDAERIRLDAAVARLRDGLRVFPGVEWVLLVGGGPERPRADAAAPDHVADVEPVAVARVGADRGDGGRADAGGIDAGRADGNGASGNGRGVDRGGVDSGGVDRAAVDRALAELDRLDRAVLDADAAVRTARREHDEAVRAAEAVVAELRSAAEALRAARDPLVPLGAPASVDDVVAGWAALTAWAAEQAAERDAALVAARVAAADTGRAREAATAGLEAATRVADDRRREETAAARAEQEARSALAGVESRLAELDVALTGAPDDAEAARLLARLDELESAARAADAAARAARAAVREAEGAVARVAREVSAAWDALRAARDPLVPLGAPAVTGEDLGSAWRELVGWAAAGAAERRTRYADADLSARAARKQREAAERAIAEDLEALDVPVRDAASPAVTAAAAPAAVASALARARAGHDRVVERRSAAAALLADRDAAEEAAQVAKMLGGLLRSDGFPRWLVASALDALVADASRSLAELSGGQFALTHDHGEFLVVDHADADALRPVKTLSGGETFQASLALALALSSQLAGLAAQGAARLESIFLDEGFGTLDEANLETVAGTLESLAARGDRMVGVVTHVAALAERVPVRFAVRRDQRTSWVEREDL